jgi:hypothetical protein
MTANQQLLSYSNSESPDFPETLYDRSLPTIADVVATPANSRLVLVAAIAPAGPNFRVVQ